MNLVTLYLATNPIPGSLPTPSPELPPAHHHIHRSPLREDLFGHSQISAWEFRSDPHAVHVSAGSKRSHDHDYNVDDFFSDMKKRRVNPSYDPGIYFSSVHVVMLD